MKTILRFLKLASFAAGLMVLTSCGGGGGGGGGTTTSSTTATGVIGSGGGSISFSNGTVATIDPGVVKDGTTVTVQTMSAPPSSSPEIQAASSLVRVQIPSGALSASGVATNGITVNIPLSSIATGVVGVATVGAAYKYVEAKIGNAFSMFGRYVEKTVSNNVIVVGIKITAQTIKQQVTQGNPVAIDFLVNTFSPNVPTAGTLFEVRDGSLLDSSFVDSLLPSHSNVPPEKLPLVLVHGIQAGCEGSANAYKTTWREFIKFFYNNPELQLKYQLYTFSYQTYSSIKANGQLFATSMRANFGGRPVVVVAHSMGGLVARSAMVHWKNIGANVGGLITLGTPHHGTLRPITKIADALDTSCFFAANPPGARDLEWDNFDDPSATSVNPFLRGPDGINTLDNGSNYSKYIPYAGLWDSTSLRCLADLAAGIPAIALDTNSYIMCVGAGDLKNVGYSSSDGNVPLVSARFRDGNYGSGNYYDKLAWSNLPRTYSDIHHISIHNAINVFTKNPDGLVGGIRADLLNFYTSIISALPPLSPAFTVSFSGLQASFDASTSTPGADITSYAWDFGDGATATGSTTSHTYATYSTWSVTLTVTDSYGRTASTSQNVSATCPVGQVIQSGQCVTPVTYLGAFSATGSMASARYGHTATLLPGGKVLVAGGYNAGAVAGAELYDPATGVWAATGSMTSARYTHTATLLPNGKVLVAGGANGAGATVAGAELYDPATGVWTAASSMTSARYYHTATLLPDGKVLAAGGTNGAGATVASAELYDPATGVWAVTGSMTSARYVHTATLLPNGKVLVAGGLNAAGGAVVASAELFDPATGLWAATDSMTSARYTHTATLLPNGKVLVAGAGGPGGTFAAASAELYDPATGLWAVTGSMASARYGHIATLLPGGKVLVMGGHNGAVAVASAELFW
jgi:PKD repeat protein/pimeloyl-ACP methyl ester carboxylesterase